MIFGPLIRGRLRLMFANQWQATILAIWIRDVASSPSVKEKTLGKAIFVECFLLHLEKKILRTIKKIEISKQILKIFKFWHDTIDIYMIYYLYKVI